MSSVYLSSVYHLSIYLSSIYHLSIIYLLSISLSSIIYHLSIIYYLSSIIYHYYLSSSVYYLSLSIYLLIDWSTYRRSFTLRYWLVCLWRLGSPTICHLGVGGPGKLAVSVKGLRTRNPNGVTPSPEAGEDVCVWARAARHRVRIQFHLLPFVHFRPSPSWMAPTHMRRATCFTQSPIQRLIFSRNTLTDMPRNKVLLVIWASRGPVKLAIELTITPGLGWIQNSRTERIINAVFTTVITYIYGSTQNRINNLYLIQSIFRLLFIFCFHNCASFRINLLISHKLRILTFDCGK